MIGVASEAFGELASAKKRNIAPIIETVGDIKDTLADTAFVKTVAKAGPEIIGKTTAAAADLIKVLTPPQPGTILIFCVSVEAGYPDLPGKFIIKSQRHKN